ncbi:MAG TPA: 2-C-methyl-D-erythritol 2,4-cyclodiphosphate synthase [Clostridia bacterium]|nr:2-C-methyl-D-erythritol 2,4-cyclodiphosphate synthase [Clostridia bacterium]
MRVGFGFDVHRLVEGRPLVIGGVTIPFERGLLGHSDADVLLHAVADALLGAAGLGDIGIHFPDTDPRYKGISSLVLLAEVRERIMAAGWAVNNVDAVIAAERPKMAPHIPAMKANIARVLNVEAAAVNIKATTTEGLGFTGRGEGIAAWAAVTLRQG